MALFHWSFREIQREKGQRRGETVSTLRLPAGSTADRRHRCSIVELLLRGQHASRECVKPGRVDPPRAAEHRPWMLEPEGSFSVPVAGSDTEFSVTTEISSKDQGPSSPSSKVSGAISFRCSRTTLRSARVRPRVFFALDTPAAPEVEPVGFFAGAFFAVFSRQEALTSRSSCWSPWRYVGRIFRWGVATEAITWPSISRHPGPLRARGGPG
jgi:hypothetical protein